MKPISITPFPEVKYIFLSAAKYINQKRVKTEEQDYKNHRMLLLYQHGNLLSLNELDKYAEWLRHKDIEN